MMITLLVISIITLFFIVTTIYGHLTESENWQWIGWIGLILVGLFGWGMAGCISEIVYEEHQVENATISKTVNNIYVETDYNIILFDKKSDYDNINSETIFYYGSWKNMYGLNSNGDLGIKYYYIQDGSQRFGENLK